MISYVVRIYAHTYECTHIYMYDPSPAIFFCVKNSLNADQQSFVLQYQQLLSLRFRVHGALVMEL